MQVVRYAIILCWILAPIVFRDVCKRRGLVIPNDIMLIVFLVWYGAGAVFVWYITKDSPTAKKRPQNPSYTKNYNDWMED